MTTLNVIGSQSGREAYGLVPSAQVDAVVLEAAVAETYTVPAGVHALLFSADGDFYARPNAVAAVPTDEVADGTAPIFNPVLWIVDSRNEAAQLIDGYAIATVSLIAAAARIVTIQRFTR